MSHNRKLSKSRYCAGVQCPKMLWLSIHQSDDAAEIDAATEWRFTVGHLVGEYAQKCFKNGVLIADSHEDLGAAIENTKNRTMAGAMAIFEATVEYDSILCRADIIKRVKKGQNFWDIYEVKSSSKVKDAHFPDVAVQRYCFEGAGYRIRNTYVMHVDGTYVRNGDIEPVKLLKPVEIGEEVSALLPGVGTQARQLLKIINSTTCPKMEIGDHCTNPYVCAFYDTCHEPVPEHSIYELSRPGKALGELEAMGVSLLKDIPDGFKLSIRNAQYVQSVKTGKPVIDAKAVRAYLDELAYPLYHLDFETICCAIPPFDKSRPYQTIPVQFSLDIQAKPCGKISHHEFLGKNRSDPREEIIKKMIDLLGSKGSIIAYNAGFETSKIQSLAEDFPHYRKKLSALVPRFWDLIVPFKNGAFAHPEFCGSASLKYVLPALVPQLSYMDLEVQEGGTASLLLEQWYYGAMTEKDWKKYHPHLLKYCGLDTRAMVEILRVLYDAVGHAN